MYYTSQLRAGNVGKKFRWNGPVKRSEITPLDFESHRKTYNYLLQASSSPTVYALMLSMMPKKICSSG